jgi:hypothetical protein
VLTRNLTAAEGEGCLVVAADDVALDLAGWVITGSGEPAPSGVTSDGPRDTIAVRNGAIRNFTDGVTLEGSGAVVEELRVSAAGSGIVSGNDSIVSGNVVLFAEDGIIAGPGSTISGNIVQGEFSGITAFCPSNVIGNTATGEGKNLVLVGDGCTNIDNLAP